MKNPILTIITVNYNSGNGLVETVDSVSHLLESFNIELILVDGLSSDDSLLRLGAKIDLFSVVISEKDNGIYDAMNKGIKCARGEWVWFLNSGDIALKSVIEIFHYLIAEKENCNFLYCNFSTKYGGVVDQNLTLRLLLRGMINHQTIFYRRDIIDHFDTNFGLCADFAHLLRHYANINHKKINTSIVRYDLNGKSSAFDRPTRVNTWYQRFRAFRYSSLRFDYKFYGMIFSLAVCLVKVCFPKLGSKTIRIKNI